MSACPCDPADSDGVQCPRADGMPACAECACDDCRQRLKAPVGRAMGLAVLNQRHVVLIDEMVNNMQKVIDAYPNCHRCGKPIHPNIPCEEA